MRVKCCESALHFGGVSESEAANGISFKTQQAKTAVFQEMSQTNTQTTGKTSEPLKVGAQSTLDKPFAKETGQEMFDRFQNNHRQRMLLLNSLKG